MTFADLALCLWAHGSPACLPPVRLAGLATVYWRGDGMSGPRLGCVAAARRLLGHHRFSDDLKVVATRDGPRCGTPVYVEHARTGRGTWARKLDTGTWGCRWADGSRTVAGRGQCWGRGGRRLAVADLTLAVARAIGHDGRDRVFLRWRDPRRGRREQDPWARCALSATGEEKLHER